MVPITPSKPPTGSSSKASAGSSMSCDQSSSSTQAVRSTETHTRRRYEFLRVMALRPPSLSTATPLCSLWGSISRPLPASSSAVQVDASAAAIPGLGSLKPPGCATSSFATAVSSASSSSSRAPIRPRSSTCAETGSVQEPSPIQTRTSAVLRAESVVGPAPSQPISSGPPSLSATRTTASCPLSSGRVTEKAPLDPTEPIPLAPTISSDATGVVHPAGNATCPAITTSSPGPGRAHRRRRPRRRKRRGRGSTRTCSPNADDA